MDGPIDVVVGTDTAVYSGEGLIATAGAIDTHVHLLSPRIVDQALAAGITTMVAQDFGPVWNLGANPAYALRRMHGAMDAWPLNLALLARGSSSRPEPLETILIAGAAGLKIHEDVGAHATALDTAVTVAEEFDVQVAVHTDGLNECLSVEDTLAVLAGRTIHAFHIEGCGGGHAPDVLRLLGEPNIIASSTNPTIPFGRDALAEHEAMVFAVHALRGDFPDDRQNARDRVRAGTMGAEDVLHDLGLIAITSSDSQGMGRVGETVRRTFQLAAKMRAERGAGWRRRQRARAPVPREVHHQPGARARAGARGRRAHAGPAGRHRAVVAVALRGQAGAGAEGRLPGLGRRGRPERDHRLRRADVRRARSSARSPAPPPSCRSRSCRRRRSRPAQAQRLPTRKRLSAVSGCRRIGAADMVRNDRLGAVRVDPATHLVTLDGEPVDVAAGRLGDAVAAVPARMIVVCAPDKFRGSLDGGRGRGRRWPTARGPPAARRATASAGRRRRGHDGADPAGPERAVVPRSHVDDALGEPRRARVRRCWTTAPRWSRRRRRSASRTSRLPSAT